MKALPTSQKVLTWLCMCSADASTSKMRLMCYAAFTFIVGIMGLFGLLSSLIYMIEHTSADLESSLYASFQLVAYLSMFNMIIVGITNRQRIAAIFTELSKLYTTSMDQGLSNFRKNCFQRLYRQFSFQMKATLLSNF